jgi:phosphate-selective porin OprO/OprP
VKLTGFFQVDSAWFDQSPNNIAAVGDAPDGTDFRRARLAAVGQAWENVGYSLEMDFAFPGRPSFMDVWLEVQDIGGTGNTVRVGQFRQPFSFTGMTSIREIVFLERPLPFAFLPFRQTGVMSYGTFLDEMGTYAVSGFRYPVDPYGGSVGDNGGYGLSTRETILLYDSDRSIVHLGGGYEYLDPASDQVQYRQTPEIFVSETGTAPVVPPGLTQIPFFVDSGVLDVDDVNMFNAELAASYGSWYATAEAFHLTVNRPGGATTAEFTGAYAETACLLTGEHRPYNRKAGVFGRVDPLCPVGKCGGWGAWEVAGRWSTIDVTDEDIDGGRLTDLTAGVNWYLNRYTKFQFNYIHGFLDSPVNGSSEVDVYAVRGQLDF